MRKIFVTMLSLLAVTGLTGQDFKIENAQTNLEEKFIYNVSWTFLHIGTITLTTERLISYPELLKITMDIETAPLLPFIDIDEHNIAIMRTSDGMTFYYFGKIKNDGKFTEVTIRYIEAENLTLYKTKDYDNQNLISSDTIRHKRPYLVGTSLINYTRMCADSGLIKTAFTLLEGKFYPTILDFCGPTEYVDIENYDEPIRSFKYKGSADWEGNATAGVSGEFTGWISDDEEKVVIYAEMEILLGSIDIELVDWYKPGWTPPSNKNFLTQTKK